MSRKRPDPVEGCVAGYPDLLVDPVIEAYKKDIDRTLLRQSLKLTVTERFEELMELQRFAEALRNARTVAQDDELQGTP